MLEKEDIKETIFCAKCIFNLLIEEKYHLPEYYCIKGIVFKNTFLQSEYDLEKSIKCKDKNANNDCKDFEKPEPPRNK